MAALTGADVVKHKEEARLVSLPVLAATQIYAGGLLMMTSAGFVAPATPTATSLFAGIATEDVDNTAGASGDVNVRAFHSGLHQMAISGVAVTDQLLTAGVFAESDNTADVTIGTASSANSQKCGIVSSVEGGLAWVDIGVGITQQELGT